MIKKFEILFNVNEHSLMIGQWTPKRVMIVIIQAVNREE
jgi:hypothetical protein